MDAERLAKQYAEALEKEVGCGVEFTTNEIEKAYIVGYIKGHERGYEKGCYDKTRNRRNPNERG